MNACDKKKDKRSKPDKVNYECKSCGLSSEKEKHLCKPQKIKKQ